MQSMMWASFSSSTMPLEAYWYMNRGSRCIGQTDTHLPQRMHWGFSTVFSSFSQKARMAPVPLATEMTPLYRRLYDEGLVSPGFSGEILSLPGALSFLFGGETPEPETVTILRTTGIPVVRAR